MPIDWRETLGALDQDTAALLARRRLEQQGLLDVIKTADTLENNKVNRRSNEEARKASAVQRTALADNLRQQAADRLENSMMPGTDIINDPKAQQILKDAGRGSAMQPVAGTPDQVVQPTGLSRDAEGNPIAGPQVAGVPGQAANVDGVPTIEQIQQAKTVSGEKPKLLYQGTPKAQYEQARVKTISDYVDAKANGDEEAAKKHEETLKLKYGMKTAQFADGKHLITVAPDGSVVDKGVVPEGSIIKNLPGGMGTRINDAAAAMLAEKVLTTGSWKDIPLGRGGMAGPVGQQISEVMAQMVASGQFSGDLAKTASLNAEANKNILTLSPKYAAIDNVALAAADSINLAIEAQKKLGPGHVYNTDSKWINEHMLPIVEGAKANPDLTDFEVKTYTAAREYMKVVSGGALSVAEMSQKAAEQAQKMLNKAQAPADFAAATKAMYADMKVIQDRNHQSLDNWRIIAQNTGKVPGGAAPAAAPAAAGGGVVDPNAGSGGKVSVGDFVIEKATGKRFPVTKAGPLPPGYEPAPK